MRGLFHGFDGGRVACVEAELFVSLAEVHGEAVYSGNILGTGFSNEFADRWDGYGIEDEFVFFEVLS